MRGDRELARWLVASRREIDARLARAAADGLPAAGSPEAEALRRFRTFAATALRSGEIQPPALDGVRVSERRFARLLDAWIAAASECAGAKSDPLREALEALATRFRAALSNTATARRARGAPKASRRAVIAAIDRVADAFFAIDTETGAIADANPAAGALLGRHRDRLVGTDLLRFVRPSDRELWWSQLDAVAEGSEPGRFRSVLLDGEGKAVDIDATVTRHANRRRTLALVLARQS